MNPRTKNLALAGGAVAVVGFIAVNTLMAPAAPLPGPAVGGASPGGPATPSQMADPAAAASPSSTVPTTTSRRSYAVGLQDLAGFPPDAAPGARLELWVTWEPPLTREPQLRKLAGDVVLERMIPGAVPEAPVTVLLSLPADKVSDLMYADTFGKLSVAIPE